MITNVTTQLMFNGQAEAALELYLDTFSNARMVSMEKYKAGEAGPEGTVKFAVFAIGQQQFNCIDSPVKHAFTFTPAFSIFVDFDDLNELEKVYASLSENGRELMPLDDYGIGERFGWVDDRFDVSWQLRKI